MIALVLIAAVVVCLAPPAQAVDITHTFQYDPDNPSNAEGFAQFEGHIRAGRSAQSGAGYNDSNWSGGDSMQVFSPETTGTRHGIMHLVGWEDEVGGLPITSASISMHLRFNANPPGRLQSTGLGCSDPDASKDCRSTVGLNQTINVRPMLSIVNIGNGDGLAPPTIARPAAANPLQPNDGQGWMTWEHRIADILDLEPDGVCTTCAGWGDGTGRDGPVEGIDYASSPQATTTIAPDFADEESPDTDGDGASDERRFDIDLTSIFQWWQQGNENKGLHFWGTTGDDPMGDTLTSVNTRLYLHGADTVDSGAPGAIGTGAPPFIKPRYLPILTITTVPEPATLGLLCLGGLVALRRTRR
jgi:hypothetical protein